MRTTPTLDVSSSHHSSRSTPRTGRCKGPDPSFENSVGYRLATEGTYGDMGANALQIWPKSQQRSNESNHKMQMPWHNSSASERAPSNKSRDDVSTLHSYRVAPRRTPELTQQSSMYSVRETAKLQKGRPALHAAASCTDIRTQDVRRGSESTNKSPKSTQSARSQRLGFSRLFGRDKDSKQSKNRYEPRAKEQGKHSDVPIFRPEVDYLGPLEPEPEPEPEPPRIIQRSQNTTFERNATENAKVNVRRPPKGIKHWFEGVDSSDEDLPEVVQPAPEPVTSATFRPSLGPSRLRAAPTARISPMAEPAQDYFHFNNSAQSQRKHSASTGPTNIQDQSILNLSSSEDSEPSEPPSPDRWAEQSRTSHGHRPSIGRSKSTDGRESMFSMQTTMTSGTIPIMHADMLYRTPLPPLPNPHKPASDVPAPLRMMRSEVNMSRHRAATNNSFPESMRSDNSTATSSTTHVMTVTPEEMALLEMMRRKRAEMQCSNSSPPGTSYRPDSSTAPLPSGIQREVSSAQSIASSSVSRDSDDNSVFGTIFPAPPTKSADRRPTNGSRSASSTSVTRTVPLERLHSDEKIVHYRPNNNSNASNHQKTLPSQPTPTFCHELEAPLLPATAYSRPTANNNSKQTGKPPAPVAYNPADPYQLAPDLDFSPLDLLPLPSRAYSPSLSTSRSSTGGTSQFSTLTPDGSSTSAGSRSADVQVASVASVSSVAGVVSGHHRGDGNIVCELDVKRNSSVKGAGNDVLAAWSALGGI